MSTPAVAAPSPASLGWPRPSAGSLAAAAVLVLALLVLFAANAAGEGLSTHWVLGLAIGVVLQRGRVCFAGAFRDLYLMRNGTMMRAILVALAVATPLFALVQARAVPNPDFGAIPQGAHVIPLGLHLFVGGLVRHRGARPGTVGDGGYGRARRASADSGATTERVVGGRAMNDAVDGTMRLPLGRGGHGSGS